MALREIYRRLWAALIVAAACSSTPMGAPKVADGSVPTTTPEVTDSCTLPGYTRFEFGVFPWPRQLDLAFVIDDSPSMAPKRDKLQRQLPRLLDTLLHPIDGNAPSLRVAILDGDLGSGGVISSGPCGPKNGSTLGDAGKLQMIGGPACGITDPAAAWLKPLTLLPANFEGDILQVFSCLANNLGQSGCNYQQPLDALAISATDPGPASLAQFVRKDAYLGLVIVSDQDDCSALPNPGIFASEISTESPSLRCATRGHECDGIALPFPTSASYTHPLTSCGARTDPQCPASTDTSGPTTCTPLKNVEALANEVKRLKSDPESQILVAGIFGWPMADAEDPQVFRRNMATAEYKLAPIPSPGVQAPSTVYDLWPVCYDPDHPPDNPDPTTGFDAVAAGYGAKPGLRLAAFMDEFGDNGLKLSICQRDWSDAMKMMVHVTRFEVHLLCFDQKVVDTDPSSGTLEPDCIADLWEPKVEPAPPPPPTCIPCDAGPACLQPAGSNEYWTKTPIPLCNQDAPVLPCWKLEAGRLRCSGNGLMPKLYREPPPYTPAGTRLRVQCHMCPDPPPSTNPDPDVRTPMPPGCDYSL